MKGEVRCQHVRGQKRLLQRREVLTAAKSEAPVHAGRACQFDLICYKLASEIHLRIGQQLLAGCASWASSLKIGSGLSAVRG